ncbi:MAG: GNAT family N-acetyltransferase [Pseudonocardiaceae bacterium]
MNDRLTVRPARPDEVDQVGRLTFEAYVADGYANPAGSYAAALADTSRRARDAELLVAVDSNARVLGTVTVCTPGSPLGELSQPGELEFRMLAVALDARRRGVGEALVIAVLPRAAEIGAHRVVMCSAAEMPVAHRLYTRLEFVRLPERDWQPVPV